MNNNNNTNVVEQWAWIPGYKGKYKVSSLGRVKSLLRNKVDGKFLKPVDNGWGYRIVNLYKDGKRTKFIIHRLVALAFIPNPENKPQVNHIDENKANNNVSNLDWMTSKENNNYGTRNERISKPVRNITTGVVYESLTAAAAELGLAISSISGCCTGRRNTCGGFQWEYVQE